jgi:hypothetical protein
MRASARTSRPITTSSPGVNMRCEPPKHTVIVGASGLLIRINLPVTRHKSAKIPPSAALQTLRMNGLCALKPPRQRVTDRAAMQRTSQEVFNLIAIASIAAPAAVPWVCAMIVVVGSLLTAGLRLTGARGEPAAV